MRDIFDFSLTWEDRYQYPVGRAGYKVEGFGKETGDKKKDDRRKAISDGDDLRFFASNIMGAYGSKWACDVESVEDIDKRYARIIYLFWYYRPDDETKTRNEFKLTRVIDRGKANGSDPWEHDNHAYSSAHSFAIKRGLCLIGFARNLEGMTIGDAREIAAQVKRVPNLGARKFNFNKLIASLSDESILASRKRAAYEKAIAICTCPNDEKIVNMLFSFYLDGVE